jgi:hypothetical protein
MSMQLCKFTLEGKKMVRKALIIADDLYSEIADFRFANRLVSEQEAFRVLLERGLAYQEGKNDRSGVERSLREDKA